MRKTVRILVMMALPVLWSGYCAAEEPPVTSIEIPAYSTYTIKSLADGGGEEYVWEENGNYVGNEKEYTSTGNPVGTYVYVRSTRAANCQNYVPTSAVTVTVKCNAVGVKAPFRGFTPCEGVPIGTTWTLRDTRDNTEYKVVKLGSKIVMAENLDYRKDLTFRDAAGAPSANIGMNTALIGSYWCPGAAGAVSGVNIRNCSDYGALYSWETAMSLDGGSPLTKRWTEGSTQFNTGAANAANSQFNHGRKEAGNSSATGGRGICPESWHVPTDNEWGQIIDYMEGNGQGHTHATTAVAGWVDGDAGIHAKSTETCESDASPANCADTDQNVKWQYHANKGLDTYGFSVLPAGLREYNGSAFSNRGISTYFWSSSAYDVSHAWYRTFHYSQAGVYRYAYYRSLGFSVRCVRD
jgi:uncharacterized protein (TIGR02145 family)